MPSVDYLINKTTDDPNLLSRYLEAKSCLNDYMSLPQRTSPRCDQAFCMVTNEYLGLLPCECKNFNFLHFIFFGGLIDF